MPFPAPTLDDLALLRTWIRGIPLASLPYPVTPAVLAKLAELRVQLHLKAVRLQMADAEIWLKRQSQAHWERKALECLEALCSAPDIVPDQQQPLSFWLAANLASPLAAKGCLAVADVVARYHKSGAIWWQDIPGLGRAGARRVEQHIADLFPGCLVRMPTVPTPHFETGIVPLERLLLPAHLDGRQGRNRAAAEPFIPLAHDLAAIGAWLALYPTVSHTVRSYQREAERLLLWSITVQNKALSSLDATDFAAYRSFLRDPQPADAWVGPPRAKGHKQWKPFTGPLSARSAQHAETLLSSLFDFLVQQRYLQHNPISALPRLKAPVDQARAMNRAFSPSHWVLIMAAAEQAVLERTGQAQRQALRTQLILHLAYATGLRLSELSQATVGDILAVERHGHRQAWLSVLGKGQKLRQVPLPPSTFTILAKLYQTLTGGELRRQAPETPLIPDLHDTRKGITSSAIYKTLKAFFGSVAQGCEKTDPEAAIRLAQASTHWLRHTHGSRAAAQGIPLVMIRDNLGHASLATTSQYLHIEADARYEAFESLIDKDLKSL